MERWKEYIKKKVFIKLKDSRVYSGIVLKIIVSKDSDFIVIKDKFGKRVSFAISDVSMIQEEFK